MSDIKRLPIKQIRPFEGHPYQVINNAEMDALAESIIAQGVLSPIIVRPVGDDQYEVISGHRRLRASQIAGRTTIPAFVREMDRDEAAIALVDSNLHRDHLLPSEKALAYKLKLEAIRHQGKRLGTARRSADLVSPLDSGRHVQRIIRLTYLIPELLKMVDENIMAFTPAVNISYLTDQEQYWVLDEMLKNDCTPSLSQALWLRERSVDETLTHEHITGLLSQQKANQRESIRIPRDKLRGVIPDTFTPEQAEEYILKACDFYNKHHKLRKEESL